MPRGAAAGGRRGGCLGGPSWRGGGGGQADGAVLELGLLGYPADRRIRQVIRGHVLCLLVAPVERDEDDASRQSRVDLDGEADQASTAAQLGRLPRGESDLGRALGVDLAAPP